MSASTDPAPWSLNKVYGSIAAKPGRASFWILIPVFVLALLPRSFLLDHTFYQQDPEWAKAVVTFTTLVLGVVFGLIPIIKWREDQRKAQQDREEEQRKAQENRVHELVARKPIVVTNRASDGKGIEIQNLAEVMAFNVWCLTKTGELRCLGGLAPHGSREVKLVDLEQPHVLIAEARTQDYLSKELQRRYVPTFNVNDGAGFRHGWDDKSADDGRLKSLQPISQYVGSFGVSLRDGLQGFEAIAPRLVPPAIPPSSESTS